MKLQGNRPALFSKQGTRFRMPHISERSVAFLLAFGVIGSFIVFATQAATSTNSLEPESGTLSGNVGSVQSTGSSGGQHIKFGAPSSGFRRFFADTASWNKTIAQFGGEETRLKDYAYRLWDYGGGTASGSPPGNFYLNFKDYSVPIYDVATANTTARVFQVVWSQNQQTFSQSGTPIGTSVPWNHNWKPGSGNDRILAVVDYEAGKAYEYWVVGEASLGCIDLFGPNSQAGFDPSNPNHLCIAGFETYDNLWTATDGSTIVGRGMGINKLALVVRAEEVARGNINCSGNIGHALPLTTSNPMFGAGTETPGVIHPTTGTNGSDPLGLGMVSPKYDPFQPGAGTTKGFYVKPATRLEHEFGYTGGTLQFGSVTMTTPTDAERSKSNPSGMRFGLHLSDADINQWLDSKGYTGAKRCTAGTFARTWRDYGAIIAETGGYGIGIETDGIIGGAVNPATAVWAQLGITDDGTSRQSINTIDFDGLITRERLYVVKPPN